MELSENGEVVACCGGPKLRMYQDNVLVLMDWLRDLRTERTTAGGLVIPATSKPGDYDAVPATVILAGTGAYNEKIVHNEGTRDYKAPKTSRAFVPMDPAVRPGARVLVNMAIAGDPLIVDGIEHRIVRQENIVGVEET